MDKDWIVLLLTLAVTLIAGYRDMKKKRSTRPTRADIPEHDMSYEYPEQIEIIPAEPAQGRAGQGHSPLMEEYLQASPERRERHESMGYIEESSIFSVDSSGDAACDHGTNNPTQPRDDTGTRRCEAPPESFDVEKAIEYAAILQPKFKSYD